MKKYILLDEYGREIDRSASLARIKRGKKANPGSRYRKLRKKEV